MTTPAPEAPAYEKGDLVDFENLFDLEDGEGFAFFHWHRTRYAGIDPPCIGYADENSYCVIIWERGKQR
jgi:hypothetical protein